MFTKIAAKPTECAENKICARPASAPCAAKRGPPRTPPGMRGGHRNGEGGSGPQRSQRVCFSRRGRRGRRELGDSDEGRVMNSIVSTNHQSLTTNSSPASLRPLRPLRQKQTDPGRFLPCVPWLTQSAAPGMNHGIRGAHGKGEAFLPLNALKPRGPLRAAALRTASGSSAH